MSRLWRLVARLARTREGVRSYRNHVPFVHTKENT